MDFKRLAIDGLADLVARRALKTCGHCGRPNPICDADRCPERLNYSCPFCRGSGIFHLDDCVNRGLGPKHPKYRRP